MAGISNYTEQRRITTVSIKKTTVFMFRSISPLISALCSQPLPGTYQKQTEQSRPGRNLTFHAPEGSDAHINCAYCELQTRSLLSDLHTNIKLSDATDLEQCAATRKIQIKCHREFFSFLIYKSLRGIHAGTDCMALLKNRKYIRAMNVSQLGGSTSASDVRTDSTHYVKLYYIVHFK